MRFFGLVYMLELYTKTHYSYRSHEIASKVLAEVSAYFRRLRGWHDIEESEGMDFLEKYAKFRLENRYLIGANPVFKPCYDDQGNAYAGVSNQKKLVSKRKVTVPKSCVINERPTDKTETEHILANTIL